MTANNSQSDSRFHGTRVRAATSLTATASARGFRMVGRSHAAKAIGPKNSIAPTGRRGPARDCEIEGDVHRSQDGF